MRKTRGWAAKHAKAGNAPPSGEITNTAPPSSDDVKTGDFSLHELFQQRAMKLLDRADISEEQKQNVLVAMSCPCCGVGGLSYTVKLKRKT